MKRGFVPISLRSFSMCSTAFCSDLIKIIYEIMFKTRIAVQKGAKTYTKVKLVSSIKKKIKIIKY